MSFMQGWDGSELKYEAPNFGTVTNWVCFWLIWLLAVWSLFRMVWSSPGYVPKHYKYD